jgi:uncharacterized cupin superfamily protein
MPKIAVDSVAERKGSGYPAPHHLAAGERVRRPLGKAGGLTHFGVNLLHLPPGAWSSQRHWHSQEDEFVWVLEGEVVLITDDGEEVLRAGECAAFPKNAQNGHNLVNRSAVTAVCLEVGTDSSDDVCTYPDIDMRVDNRDGVYRHMDGTPYPQPDR